MKSPSFPHVQCTPGSIENNVVGAHEHGNVTVTGAGEDHFDPPGGSGLGGQFDFHQRAEHAVGVGSLAEQVDAGLPMRADGVGGVVADNDGSADPLDSGLDDGDGEVGGIVGGDKPSAYFHFDFPRKNVPADWSVFAGKKVIKLGAGDTDFSELRNTQEAA